MRAFVTGGTGLVGRHLVHALLSEGWEVTILTRDASRARDLASRGVHVAVGDLTRPKFGAEMSRADVVFHTAAWYEVGVRDGRGVFDVNVTGTANVFATARKENVGRVVYTSTAGLFAPAAKARPATEASSPAAAVDDPYVGTKLEAHRIAVGEMHAGLPLTIVMPAAVFGPGDTGALGRTLALLVRGRLRVLPRGLGTNTWAHAADVAQGHVLAGTKGRAGEAYLLGDRVLTMAEFYGVAARAANRSPPRAIVPITLARLAARLAEFRGRMGSRTSLLSRAALDLARLDVVVDATKARRELGWSPAPFAERVRETMAWYVERYSDPRAHLPVKRGGASA